MKYAPEKAKVEELHSKVTQAIEDYYAEERRLMEAGEAVNNERPHHLYKEERRLKRLVEAFPPIYEVGDGLSLNGYTDVDPYEVIEVSKSGKKIKCREMKATRDPNWKPDIKVGGFAGHCVNNNSQKWILESDPDGRIMEVSLRNIKCDPHYNDGLERIEKWVPVGRAAKIGEYPISPGARKFYDYNF